MDSKNVVSTETEVQQTALEVMKQEEHFVKIENDVDVETCHICKKSFDKSTLDAHYLTHGVPKEVQCQLCEKTFPSKQNLYFHTKLVHKGEKKNVCEICNKAFVMRSTYLEHIKLHDEKQHVCKICHKPFTAKNSLTQHERKFHGAKNYLQCEICHSEVENLAAHIKNAHESEAIKCKLCKKVLQNRNSYNRHIRENHNKEKKYQCTLCNKTYFDKVALETHLNVHKNERSYPCDNCEKSFLSLPDKKEHVQNVHKNIRNF